MEAKYCWRKYRYFLHGLPEFYVGYSGSILARLAQGSSIPQVSSVGRTWRLKLCGGQSQAESLVKSVSNCILSSALFQVSLMGKLFCAAGVSSVLGVHLEAATAPGFFLGLDSKVETLAL